MIPTKTLLKQAFSAALAWSALTLACGSHLARAEDFPFESTSEKEFEKGFAPSQGLTDLEKGESERDRLTIGGALESGFYYYGLDSASPYESSISNPYTLWFYLDSKLRNDTRGFVKVRTVYDPTVRAGSVSPLTGLAQSRSQTDLEEMKLMFHLRKKVFFTVGQQKIKWGSAKFWNPTDLMNTQFRDFLYSDDRRTGISLLKTHVPVGAANFYLLQRLDNADRVNRIQHAVRAEVPVATAEIAATATGMEGQKPVFGLDLSTAVWDLDAYGEVSFTQGTDQTFYSATAGAYQRPDQSVTSWVAGLSYDVKYSDNDLITFAAEYFQNGVGYRNASDYVTVVLSGGYEPYRLSRQYGMFMIALPSPGSWEKVSFSLFNLANLTDRSYVTKLSTRVTAWDDLNLELGLGAHYGNSSGEFTLGGQKIDASARILVNF